VDIILVGQVEPINGVVYILKKQKENVRSQKKILGFEKINLRDGNSKYK